MTAVRSFLSLTRGSHAVRLPLVLRSAVMKSDGRVEGADPLAPFPTSASQHLLRTDGFPHVADIMVGSFYDPALDEGCAFEELISFHGGMGGPQTRAFLLAPSGLPLPEGEIVGAEHVHEILVGWRRALQGNGQAGAAGDGVVPAAGRA